MAYSDYGAFIYKNGKRRQDKEDVAVFATDEEMFGTDSANVPSGARIWVSLMHRKGEYSWLNSIHHGVMGDGPVRVMCHKQGLPQIYEMTDDGPKEIKYCDESVDPYEYGTIDFEYKGHKFHFEDGHPYTMTMTEPDGTVWLGEYDYEYGAGFED